MVHGSRATSRRVIDTGFDARADALDGSGQGTGISHRKDGAGLIRPHQVRPAADPIADDGGQPGGERLVHDQPPRLAAARQDESSPATAYVRPSSRLVEESRPDGADPQPLGLRAAHVVGADPRPRRGGSRPAGGPAIAAIRSNGRFLVIELADEGDDEGVLVEPKPKRRAAARPSGVWYGAAAGRTERSSTACGASKTRQGVDVEPAQILARARPHAQVAIEEPEQEPRSRDPRRPASPRAGRRDDYRPGRGGESSRAGIATSARTSVTECQPGTSTTSGTTLAMAARIRGRRAPRTARC